MYDINTALNSDVFDTGLYETMDIAQLEAVMERLAEFRRVIDSADAAASSIHEEKALAETGYFLSAFGDGDDLRILIQFRDLSASPRSIWMTPNAATDLAMFLGTAKSRIASEGATSFGTLTDTLLFADRTEGGISLLLAGHGCQLDAETASSVVDAIQRLLTLLRDCGRY
jgi:hypothetical protein